MKTLLAVAIVSLAALSFPSHALEISPEMKEAIVREAVKALESKETTKKAEVERKLEKAVEKADAELARKIAEEKANTPAVPVETRIVNNANEWSKLGTNLGLALVGVAKEAGMAVSQFADTNLGKATMFIIAYKVMGHDVIHTTLAFLVFFAGIAILPALYRYLAYNEVVYENVPVLWGAFTIRKVKSITMNKADSNSDIPTGVGVWLAMLGFFIVICLATGKLMP
jgi:hypothetical protein